MTGETGKELGQGKDSDLAMLRDVRYEKLDLSIDMSDESEFQANTSLTH